MNNEPQQTCSTGKPQPLADVFVIKGIKCIGDIMVLVALETEPLLWFSDSFQVAFPSICQSGKSALFKAFACLEANLIFLASEKQTVSGTIESIHCSLDEKIRLYNIDYSKIESDFFLLRFNDLSGKATETKRYLEDREQLFSMSRTLGVSEMATALAHELNQPIGTLNNLLEGMKSRLPANSDLHYAIQLAQQQTRFSADVITRIRDYTRRKKPKLAVIGVGKLVNESIALLDWELTKSSVKTTIQIPDIKVVDIKISGDYLMLQQVLINLLRNSIDALLLKLPDERNVQVVAENDSNNVLIKIIDTGSGVTDEQKEKLFLPFSSTKPTGMGIGLNICRSFIELHQGRLWLDKNELGGCTAFITLPLVSTSRE